MITYRYRLLWRFYLAAIMVINMVNWLRIMKALAYIDAAETLLFIHAVPI